jgi:gamma-butyrobetaine dioxygenase
MLALPKRSFALTLRSPAWLAARGLAHITSAERKDKDRMLDVQWSDGIKGRFPYVWLRDNCPADHSYLLTDQSKSRTLLFKDLDINVKPEKVIKNEDAVHIVWPGSKSATYKSEWLQKRNLSNPQLRQGRKNLFLETTKVPWDRATITKMLKPVNWNNMWSDKKVFYETLLFLNNYGIVLLEDAPTERGQTLRLGKELGYFKPTNYGETFDVMAMKSPTSLAYTANELGFHTDIPHMYQMPEVQGLHCIRATGSEDGETLFVDAFEAARQVKTDYPDHYKLLCSVPLEYVDDMTDEQQRSYKQFARHPVLNFGDDGNLKYVAWSNLLRSWYYDLSPEEIPKVYEAMEIFQNYLYKEENFIKFRFKPGKCSKLAYV